MAHQWILQKPKLGTAATVRKGRNEKCEKIRIFVETEMNLLIEILFTLLCQLLKNFLSVLILNFLPVHCLAKVKLMIFLCLPMLHFFFLPF